MSEFMERAYELSKRGFPSPNPYVGAVVVRDGKVVSEGYHQQAGLPHAEVEALRGIDARGATLYVTLEPCSHHGRTPPCTDAIIEAEIAEVVYAMDDPTDKVRGREILEKAGIDVRAGELSGKIERLNEAFIKHSKTSLPFVTLKAAMTLDGQTATAKGKSKWITGEAARKRVHHMRASSDAIITGIGTVLADDPKLTARDSQGPDPTRIILDSKLRIPSDAKVLAGGNAVIVTTESATMRDVPAEVIVCGEDEVDIEGLLAIMGGRGITSIMVEAGAKVNASFLGCGLIDKLVLFIAPKAMGGANRPVFSGDPIAEMDEANDLVFIPPEVVGDDIMLSAYPAGD